MISVERRDREDNTFDLQSVVAGTSPIGDNAGTFSFTQNAF